jgi:hypothetical protein
MPDARHLIYEQLYRPSEPSDPLPDPDTSSTTRRLWATAGRVVDALAGDWLLVPATVPTVWELPLEPGPEVTGLWDRHGCHWQRDVPGHWLLVEPADAGEGRVWHPVVPCVLPWQALVAEHGPLSAVPPEPEVPDAAG